MIIDIILLMMSMTSMMMSRGRSMCWCKKVILVDLAIQPKTGLPRPASRLLLPLHFRPIQIQIQIQTQIQMQIQLQFQVQIQPKTGLPCPASHLLQPLIQIQIQTQIRIRTQIQIQLQFVIQIKPKTGLSCPVPSLPPAAATTTLAENVFSF